MTPFTNSTPENFEDGCIHHCEDQGWLPADGEADTEYIITDDDFNYLELPLLIPTSYVACPCSPLWSMNPEMEAVV